MPKKRRIITKQWEMDDIISKCECCHVAMVDENNMPYVLPFNFGYKDKCIYLHSGQAGRKIDILKKNNRVCVAFSNGYKLSCQSENVACSYIMSYKSVICYGKVVFIEDIDKKIEAMNIIMQQYVKKDFTYSEPAIKNVFLFKVEIDEMTAKEFGNLS
ncbi:MAG TPA: pyridoxamine 5'-phosphate oxidase family protein [Bacteroidales bacterium]|mgnify:CR=1 FL=1|nr:pyridoxamine 5'-phosphate oxidase family protein [Bacteroidales bacterium]HPS17077.1 pyridoxamine 5'-phosphate oxidase family protein [Bacteroidales bacterium]